MFIPQTYIVILLIAPKPFEIGVSSADGRLAPRARNARNVSDSYTIDEYCAPYAFLPLVELSTIHDGFRTRKDGDWVLI